ncbi:MAG TPA: single-stranded DNA-binding protein, partial [Patescibacteria group bacterium]|nr:single-stranded DNA-binding protein [Patescibacteria group bacterium]
VSKYCRKGESIYIQGRLHTRDYTDKDGNKKHITEILAESVIFLSAKKVSEKAPEMEQVHTGGDAPPPPRIEDDLPF